MYAKYLVLYVSIVQTLIIVSNVTYCLRLDRTGWRTINVNVETLPSVVVQNNNSQQTTIAPIRIDTDDLYYHHQTSSPKKLPKTTNLNQKNENNLKQKESDDRNFMINRKLVQWDDDDFNFNLSNNDNNYNLLEIPRKKIIQNKSQFDNTLKSVNKFIENKIITAFNNQNKPLLRNKTKAKDNNRLIYHGQIKQNNSVKFIDGIKLVVNTHQPVPINRRSWANKAVASSSFADRFINNNLPVGWLPDNEQYSNNNDEKQLKTTTTTSVNLKNAKFEKINPNVHASENNKLGDDESAKGSSVINSSSSDWKPITIAQSQRKRRSKQQSIIKKANEPVKDGKQFVVDKNKESPTSNNNKNNKGLEIITNDNKWKPINVTTTTSKQQRVKEDKSKKLINKTNRNDSRFDKKNDDTFKETIVYGEKITLNHHSTINEPFDEDDGIFNLRRKLGNSSPIQNISDDLEEVDHNNSHFDKRQSIEHNYKPTNDKNSTIAGEKKSQTDENKWVPLDTRTTTSSYSNLAITTKSDEHEDLDSLERRITTTTTTTSTESTPTTVANNFNGLNSTSNTNSSISSGGSSITETAAHRSASDLNYIYSSQPQQDSFRQPTTGGSSYYSNYLIQQQQQPAPPPTIIDQAQQPMTLVDQPAIIDTTSGQVPEMIGDRVPEAPINTLVGASTSGVDPYSLPQTGSSFQPAQPPPMRATSSFGNGYGDNHYYQQPQPNQQPVRMPAQPIVGQQQQQQQAQSPYNYGYNNQQQQQQQFVQSTTSAPQVVRQEHHYHYYNQQQQQRSNAFQQDRSSQFVPNQQQQPIQSVIREVQPVFISQPIIQQQPSTSTTTTQAPPQIIREIIKEVPMVQSIQPIQMPTRFIQIAAPQPPPAAIVLPQQQQQQQAIQFQFQRDQPDASASFMQTYAASLAAPAQRVIRQISNSIPTVAVRIPPVVVPQIRLPATIQQAFQLPVRLASATGSSQQQSITRQTASFVIPPMPKKTTTYLTETQAMPTHTTIMHTTQFTPATRTTVYTTDHQQPSANRAIVAGSSGAYAKRRRR